MLKLKLLFHHNLILLLSLQCLHAWLALFLMIGKLSLASFTCINHNIFSDSVIITLGIIKNEVTQVLVSSPRNPVIYSMSSYFSICLMYGNTITNCDK